MKTNKLYWVSLVGLLMWIAPHSAPAQMANFYSSPGYSTFVNNLISNHIWNSSMARYTGNYQGASGSSRSTASSSNTPEVVPAYRQYPAVKFKSTGGRLTVQEYIDSIQGSPELKAEVQTMVQGIFKDYEAAAAAKGYPNDWALAYVSYIGLNSHVLKGVPGKPAIPFEQNIGLRDVVAEQATDSGILSSLSDRQKQEQYELFVMVGGLTYMVYEKALRENNAEELKQSKIGAAQNLKLVGIKP